jgi:hypothetical protein
LLLLSFETPWLATNASDCGATSLLALLLLLPPPPPNMPLSERTKLTELDPTLVSDACVVLGSGLGLFWP